MNARILACLRRCLSALSVIALVSACGGGGGGGGGGAATGSLTVTVTGLPAGIAAAIVVTGPGGFTQNVTVDQTVLIVAPGSYTLTATNVLNGTAVFAPQPAAQTIAVAAGVTATGNVAYANAGAL